MNTLWDDERPAQLPLAPPQQIPLWACPFCGSTQPPYRLGLGLTVCAGCGRQLKG